MANANFETPECFGKKRDLQPEYNAKRILKKKTPDDHQLI